MAKTDDDTLNPNEDDMTQHEDMRQDIRDHQLGLDEQLDDELM